MAAEEVEIAVNYTAQARATEKARRGDPPDSTLTRARKLWSEVLPDRSLEFTNSRLQISRSFDGADQSPISYDPSQASDGEKTAFYIIARVLTATSKFVVVDEPELHLHSHMATRLWNALEAARPDVRFIYVTHDLNFAVSRSGAHFFAMKTASSIVSLGHVADVPAHLASDLIGAATAAFRAVRIVCCESTPGRLDSKIYNSWFKSPDTTVLPVGSCQEVLRYMHVLDDGSILTGHTGIGIIDRDVRPARFLESVSSSVFVLDVHEVESLFALPDVVDAVCEHQSRTFSRDQYRLDLLAAVRPHRDALVIQRWKYAMESSLVGTVATAGKSGEGLDGLRLRLTDMFDEGSWTVRPVDLLAEQEAEVAKVFEEGSQIADILRLVPGKPLLAVAASCAGMNQSAFADLVCARLGAQIEGDSLAERLEAALTSWLPPRVTGEERA